MIEYFTRAELEKVPLGSVFLYDVESYPNYFCVSFMELTTRKVVSIEISPDTAGDIDLLRWIMWRFCLVGFYSNYYDLPMITLATYDKTAKELNDLSLELVIGELRPYQFEKKYKIKLPQINHIDLYEVAPLDGSLKLYGARMHTERIQDLPYAPTTILTKEQAAVVLDYNANDLQHTYLLLVELAPHIDLRQDLGRVYGKDMRSLSDAQTAETIICTELQKVLGFYPRKPEFETIAQVAKYKVPDNMHFNTPILQEALKVIRESEFEIKHGKAVMPARLKNLLLPIGPIVYKMGMGGLHSQEKSASYKAEKGMLLLDRDVASYYPQIILNQGLYPKQLGPAFLNVYASIVERRLRAKKEGNKKVSEGLKIAINGIFGKFGNMYSAVYSPDLMLQVTLSGQLYLLMLIEMLQAQGITVVSGNTDGVIIYCHESKYHLVSAIIADWEKITGFVTEETRYKAVYSRDVNNYVAIKEKADAKGKLLSDRLGCKVKGVYSEVGSAQNSILSKNPETLICTDAILQMLTSGMPLEETITSCKDVRRFVSVKNVKGGGVKDGEYLGRVVRWNYARGERTALNYRTSRNKVGKSDGGKPLMVLPDSVPKDIDYDHYIATSEKMLFDIGFYKQRQTTNLF